VSARPRDTVSLVAGLAVTGLGLLLVLDALEAIDLSFAYLAPAVTATAGAILLVHGLSRSRER